MVMSNCGLTKLAEECAELAVVCAKKIAYMHTDQHPDGSNLRTRLQEEIADVLASIQFVVDKLKLDDIAIDMNVIKKSDRFHQWDSLEVEKVWVKLSVTGEISGVWSSKDRREFPAGGPGEGTWRLVPATVLSGLPQTW